MKITPLELRQFEFEKTFRGYSIEEVDMFINNLAQEWERVLTETKMMRMQLELAEKEAAKLREIELTLFKTLKTAEDTSTMITEQANQQAAKNISEANLKAEKQVADAQLQAEKYVAEAKIEAEKILSDARVRANETLQQANDKAKYVKEDVLSDVKAIENDFNTLVTYKEQLLTQMRGFASATIDHVERFENKFDIPAIESKINKANELVAVDETDELGIFEVSPGEKLKAGEVSVKQLHETAAETIGESATEDTEQELTDEESEAEVTSESDESSDNQDSETFEIDEETIEEAAETTAAKAENPYINEVVDSESQTEADADEEQVEESVVEVVKAEEEEVVENYDDEEIAPFSVDDDDELDEEDYSVVSSIKEKIAESEPEEEGFDEGETVVSTIPSSANKLVSEDVEYTDAMGDDLTRIEGVGPKIQDILKDVGIRTFRDIATTPLYKIKEHLRNAGSQYNMVDASTWTEQALLAAEGRWDELEVRQKELMGGREVVEEVAEPAKETEISEETLPLKSNKEVVESNLENITEEMLEKVNKVKSAIRKAMSEKKEKGELEKDVDTLPTLDDVLNRNRKKGSGSFFDNID